MLVVAFAEKTNFFKSDFESLVILIKKVAMWLLLSVCIQLQLAYFVNLTMMCSPRNILPVHYIPFS